MEYTECRKWAENLLEKAKQSLAADGVHQPILFAIDQGGGVEIICLQGSKGPVAATAKAEVKRVGAYAAVVVDEVTFSEFVDGVVRPEYSFPALTVACVHPNGHTVWITPFAKEHGILFGRTKVLEGDAFVGEITEILG